MGGKSGESRMVSDWLRRTGIVREGAYWKRVIVDMQFGKVTKVYAEEFHATDSWILAGEPPDLSNVEVVVLKADDAPKPKNA